MKLFIFFLLLSVAAADPFDIEAFLMDTAELDDPASSPETPVGPSTSTAESSEIPSTKPIVRPSTNPPGTPDRPTTESSEIPSTKPIARPSTNPSGTPDRPTTESSEITSPSGTPDRPTTEPSEVPSTKPIVRPSRSPSGTPEPDNRPLKEKLDVLGILLKAVIRGVNIDEHGFVPHDYFNKTTEALLNSVLKVKQAVMEAMKPLFHVFELAKADFKACNLKLRKAFLMGFPKCDIEKLAGNCFLVLHRPFLFSLRHAIDKGLFDQVTSPAGHTSVKRDVVAMVKRLKAIEQFFGRFRDGKPDFPYIYSVVHLVKEGQEFFKEVFSAVKLRCHDYRELAEGLMKSLKDRNIDSALRRAGRFYLSNVRRFMKAIAIISMRNRKIT